MQVPGLKRVLRFCNPIVWWLALRRCLTSASVTLLLIGIVSMNIVWGYPWMGMFATCFAMFVVGWIVNRILTPRVKVSVDSAPAVRVDENLLTAVTLIHEGRLPAMNLKVAFERERGRGAESKPIGQPTWISELAPGGWTTFKQTIVFSRRGVCAVPLIRVESLFPFYLFRSTQKLDCEERIAVTPRRIDPERDLVWQAIRANLRGLATGLSQGDHLQYVGSREYRVGMSVRRWDFASWARLGKPILREFNSPSKQTVTILVDTTPDTTAASNGPGEDASLERLLSLAAAGLETLVGGGVQVRLVVPWPLQITPADCHAGENMRVIACAASGDVTHLLMALAEATSITSDESAEAFETMLHSPGVFHGVVFARRSRESAFGISPADVLWLDTTQTSRPRSRDTTSSPAMEATT